MVHHIDAARDHDQSDDRGGLAILMFCFIASLFALGVWFLNAIAEADQNYGARIDVSWTIDRTNETSGDAV